MLRGTPFFGPELSYVNVPLAGGGPFLYLSLIRGQTSRRTDRHLLFRAPKEADAEVSKYRVTTEYRPSTGYPNEEVKTVTCVVGLVHKVVIVS